VWEGDKEENVSLQSQSNSTYDIRMQYDCEDVLADNLYTTGKTQRGKAGNP
jgi:hypothetical protein